MKISIKSVIVILRLVAFSIMISSAYFLYSSYQNYDNSKKIYQYSKMSDTFSKLLTNIGKERINSSIFVLSKNSIPFIQKELVKSRIATDNIIKKLSKHKNFIENYKLNSVFQLLKQLPNIRKKIDKFQSGDNYFKKLNFEIIKHENIISEFNYIKELKSEIKSDILITKAINRNLIENSIISSYILMDKPLPKKIYKYLKMEIQSIDASLPINLFRFDLLDGINRLAYKINLEDITEARSSIDFTNLEYYNQKEFYGYTIDISDWNDVINTHIQYLNIIKSNINKYIKKKAKEIQNHNLQIFITALIIFIISILLQIGSFVIERSLQKTTDTLSELLHSLADIVGIKTELDISTNEGQTEAYHVIETSIEQINQEKINANRANQAKSLFLANMSHEIRTPINGVMGFIELLRYTKLDKTQLDYLNTIDISAKNLLLIINQILDISKIESDKMELYLEEFDPCKEFSDSINIYSAKAAQQNIDLSVFIDPNLPKVIKGDSLKLKEILTNLISNALKFTDANGEVNIQIINKKMTDKKVKIYFEVTDTGIGMTEQQTKKIFEPFVQADLSTTKNYGGTGLGMTIVSKYVEMMNGKIEVKSKPTIGTTFYYEIEFEVVDEDICVSRKQTKHQIDLLSDDSTKNLFLMKYLEHFNIFIRRVNKIDEIQNILILSHEKIEKELLDKLEKKGIKYILFTNVQQNMLTLDYNPLDTFLNPIFPKTFYKRLDYILKKQKIENYNPLQGKKALLVEDNLINQQLMSIILKDLSINVKLVFNGEEAVDEFRNNHSLYDVIFMDITMPVMDGIEATRLIRTIEKEYSLGETPIIALTANVFNEDREAFFEAGGTEFLAKPTTQTVLIATLSKILK